MRLRLFSTALLVSYGQLKLLHYSQLLKTTCVGQVVFDKWFALIPALRGWASRDALGGPKQNGWRRVEGQHAINVMI